MLTRVVMALAVAAVDDSGEAESMAEAPRQLKVYRLGGEEVTLTLTGAERTLDVKARLQAEFGIGGGLPPGALRLITTVGRQAADTDLATALGGHANLVISDPRSMYGALMWRINALLEERSFQGYHLHGEELRDLFDQCAELLAVTPAPGTVDVLKDNLINASLTLDPHPQDVPAEVS